MTSLISVARDILARAIDERYEPSTNDMITNYGLTEQQMATVKRYVKEYAADQKLTWGYYPALNRYVLDQDDSGRAHTIINYGHQQVAYQVQGVIDQARGANAGGHLSDKAYKAATRNYRRMTRELRKVAEATGEAA